MQEFEEGLMAVILMRYFLLHYYKDKINYMWDFLNYTSISNIIIENFFELEIIINYRYDIAVYLWLAFLTYLRFLK